jgi:hypothetical protein
LGIDLSDFPPLGYNATKNSFQHPKKKKSMAASLNRSRMAFR